VNNAMSDTLLAHIPRNRMLPETDFPSSRRRTLASRPGDIRALEQRLASRDGSRTEIIRKAWYRNLRNLSDTAATTSRMPPTLQALLS
jgi:TatD DNase family protein